MERLDDSPWSREAQISRLKRLHDSLVIDGDRLEISFSVEHVDLKAVLFLPPRFPEEPPQFYVTVPGFGLKHPLIKDVDGSVSLPELAPQRWAREPMWLNSVLDEIVAAFFKDPPSLLGPLGAPLEDPAVYIAALPPVPTSLPRLDELSLTQLHSLLEEEHRANFVNSLPFAAELAQAVTSAEKAVADKARANAHLAREIDTARATVERRRNEVEIAAAKAQESAAEVSALKRIFSRDAIVELLNGEVSAAESVAKRCESSLREDIGSATARDAFIDARRVRGGV